MQNLFATSVLVVWPVVIAVMFSRLRTKSAVAWSIMISQMLLPAGAFIKFEGIPQFDKVSICNLSLLACCLVAGKWPRFFSGSLTAGVLILIYLISPVVTSYNNSDPIVMGAAFIPGVSVYDGTSAAASAFIALIPFLIGRELLRSSASHREILHILVLAGLFYSLPLLFEMRFSPQLQIWIYGFASAEWYQSVRDGGFRPIVFMGHGLVAAMFTLMSAVSAATFWRARLATYSIKPSTLTSYLAAVLALCRSAGATVYGLMLIPLVYFAKPRLQMIVAVAFAFIAIAYPIMRSQDLFPTKALLDMAELIGTERAASLKYRFDNEDMLLNRALERPLLGWGRYGRSRVYDSEGRDMSVTDGRWIITFGEGGFVGFVAEFGLLAIGILKGALALKNVGSRIDRLFLASLALIVGVSLVDLLPNSGLVPWTWLMAGALLGRADELLYQSKSNKPRRASFPSTAQD